jgi:hypothetical protein
MPVTDMKENSLHVVIFPAAKTIDKSEAKTYQRSQQLENNAKAETHD